MKTICLALLLLVSISARLHADQPADSRWPPRLLLNSDCGTPVFYKFDAPMTKDQLCRVVNDLPGTQVDAFLPCPQFSDDQVWFPSRVGEPYDGRHVKDGQFEDKYFKRVAENVRSLAERGIDPLQVWEQRSDQLGLLFIPTLRMNDVHKDYVDRWPSLRSDWEKQRTHLLIGEAIPPWYTYPYKYTWAMDYAHEEVRKRKLHIITEICTRYDVDGIEMDFLRHVYYFRHGEEATGAKLMNLFVRQVRGRLDEIGRKKGKRLRLLVRVPPQPAECEQIGLDVPTWVKSGWIDMVIAMSPGYLDMDADIASFVKLTEGTDCLVAGGLEYYVRGYENRKGITWASIEMLRAGAASFWRQGASSIYLFNYDCHGPFPFRGEKRQAIQEIGDPAKLVGRDKHYLITVDMSQRTLEKGGNKQLPVVLGGKLDRQMFHLFIGDDLRDPSSAGALSSAELIISASGAGNLQIQINGHNANPQEQTDSRLLFRSSHLVQGKNQLEVRLKDTASKTTSRIAGIEFWVRYR